MLNKPLVVEYTPLLHICLGRLQSKSQALDNDVDLYGKAMRASITASLYRIGAFAVDVRRWLLRCTIDKIGDSISKC